MGIATRICLSWRALNRPIPVWQRESAPTPPFPDIQESIMLTRLAFPSSSILLALLLFSTPTASAEGKIDPGMRDAISKVLVVQNTPQMVEDQLTYGIADQMLSAIAASGITVTEAMQVIVVDVARKSFGSRISDIEYLTDLYAPVYVEHYSEKDLRELIAFWESPVGKKTIAVMPKMTQDSSIILQEASATFLPEFEATVAKRLEEAGIAIAP